MDAVMAKTLRESFPADTIGKLPRITCRECSESQQKTCGKPGHGKEKCPTCNNYVTKQHAHLDYVGHAATTDRLLKADPTWTWEPVAFDAAGLPAFDRNNGLWIRLTVGGVTRYGWGDGKSVKECIGDAIRNAAMRFGVALDLWAKEDLNAEQREPLAAPSAALPAAPAAPPTTDAEWHADFCRRIDTCSNLPELRGLWSELRAMSAENRVAAPDYDATESVLRARADELTAKPEAVPA